MYLFYQRCLNDYFYKVKNRKHLINRQIKQKLYKSMLALVKV